MENNKDKPDSSNHSVRSYLSGKNLTIILISLASLLVVLIIVLGWLLYDRKKEAVKLEEVTVEKFELIREFEDLSREYEGLRTDNDSINRELEARQEEVEKLISDLNRTRANNAAAINEYRRELGTLRDVLKSYIVQVDSLNQANIRLREENVQVRQQVVRFETQLKQEREVKEDLSLQVEKGSRLMVENLVASPINQRGREINRIGRVEQIQVCFTLKRNAIAAPGMRTAYVRIKRPDQLVLASSAANIMIVDDEPMVYTASREINYENIDIDACIYFNDDGSLIPGTYEVELYTDGYQIGTSRFSLR
jgi:predicted nuclease with TOPRIM domain